jgi:hypothetical protein
VLHHAAGAWLGDRDVPLRVADHVVGAAKHAARGEGSAQLDGGAPTGRGIAGVIEAEGAARLRVDDFARARVRRPPVGRARGDVGLGVAVLGALELAAHAGGPRIADLVAHFAAAPIGREHEHRVAGLRPLVAEELQPERTGALAREVIGPGGGSVGARDRAVRDAADPARLAGAGVVDAGGIAARAGEARMGPPLRVGGPALRE